MKKSEVKQLLKLDDKFQMRCTEICKLLKPSRPYMSTFIIGDEYVECEGDDYWSYGGHEHYAGKFLTEYLWMSDDEIKSIVDLELEKQNEAIQEQSQKRLQEQELKEREEYERLKAKFDKNN